MSQFYNDSIFWIEVDKIRPNPYQPRREFDQAALQSLSDSIKQYGVLQALVVTRKEEQNDEGITAYYELIAGERRLRASRLAGLSQVPVLIKTGEENDLLKLELAIIENVQREDLNPVDRARAFQKLAEEFGFKHHEIGTKIGKSREYVSNSIRILSLPEYIIETVSQGKITEGHSRALMMLVDRPQEQDTLLKEIMYKKLTVREAENIARKIAKDRVRKKDREFDPELVEFEEKLAESLGTRVQIERRENGGHVTIDFFSTDDLQMIVELLNSNKQRASSDMMNRFIAAQQAAAPQPQRAHDAPSQTIVNEELIQETVENTGASPAEVLMEGLNDMEASREEMPHQEGLELGEKFEDDKESTETNDVPIIDIVREIAELESEPSTFSAPIDDRTPEEIKQDDDDDIYSVRNFSL